MAQTNNKTKYLLSLDGGGVRAIASVIFLKKLVLRSTKVKKLHL